MNLEEAKNIFGISPELGQEEIQELIEQKLFENKNDVLQKYAVPTLLLKKLKQLNLLGDAEELIFGKVAVSDFPSHELTGPYFTQTLFLEAYEKNISDVKLRLMNVSDFRSLCDATVELSDLQEIYMEMFKEQFNEYSEALPEEVNTRDIIDSGTLLQGLKAGELHAHMIWNIERELARISKIQKLG
ncbi:MAG: hypothetical protein ACKVOK_06130 [Flavobacteriales bacterium]